MPSRKDIWVCRDPSFLKDCSFMSILTDRHIYCIWTCTYLGRDTNLTYALRRCSPVFSVAYPLMVVYPHLQGNCLLPTPLGTYSILYRKIWICCVANVPRTRKSEFGFSSVLKWRVQWLFCLSSKAGQGLISSRAKDPWLNLACKLRRTFPELDFLLIWWFYLTGTLILFYFALFLMKSLSHTMEKRLAA